MVYTSKGIIKEVNSTPKCDDLSERVQEYNRIHACWEECVQIQEYDDNSIVAFLFNKNIEKLNRAHKQEFKEELERIIDNIEELSDSMRLLEKELKNM
jgi:hypothetical protein